MTLLYYYKPHYRRGGGGIPVHGLGPEDQHEKKRKKKKIRKVYTIQYRLGPTPLSRILEAKEIFVPRKYTREEIEKDDQELLLLALAFDDL